MPRVAKVGLGSRRSGPPFVVSVIFPRFLFAKTAPLIERPKRLVYLSSGMHRGVRGYPGPAWHSQFKPTLRKAGLQLGCSLNVRREHFDSEDTPNCGLVSTRLSRYPTPALSITASKRSSLCAIRTSGCIPIPRFVNAPKTGQIVCYRPRTFHLLRTQRHFFR